MEKPKIATAEPGAIMKDDSKNAGLPTAFGNPATWEDSPAGWPQRWRVYGELLRTNGRPTAQWPRLEAGRSDDLGTARR